MKPNVYKCKSYTDATDKANLYYIASPTAGRIERNQEERRIKIYGKKPAPLAEFVYEADKGESKHHPKRKSDPIKRAALPLV